MAGARTVRGWWRAALLIAAVCALAALLRPAFAKPDPFPRPPELERDIQFWIRVYTQIDTNSGYLHDENNLSVVYEALHFSPNTSPREREREVSAARDRIVASLKRIATTGPQDLEDQRIRKLWGDDGTPIRLLEATNHIRFQLGQSDRFREGLERAGKWEAHIAETLANLGLPPELAVLPHVESSFNPAAHSKVGAAGLWQFMRSTGRRYMRIDSTVDYRLDPFRSTEAAAQLLEYNYRLLGTWPLAITAWNHGAAGVRRAVETLGTDNIATILRHYTSPSFGFASRNFYVSFLAALEIDRNPEKYFGHIRRDPEVRFQEVTLPLRASTRTLERALDIDADTLRALNPALRPVCWRAGRPVPKGYHLRLPAAGTHWTAVLLAQRLGARTPRILLAKASVASRGAAVNEVPAASVGPIASGAPLARLAQVDGAARETAAHAEASTPAPAQRGASESLSPETARIESDEDTVAIAAIGAPAAAAQPVSAAQAEALGPALGPTAVEATATADPIDYSVSKNQTIVVAATETLGHYADWLHVSAARLRKLNHLRRRSSVVMGRHIKLDFHRVPPELFEAKRREYHRSLEASYFAEHRIAGTRVYIARRGDSLWTVTHRYARLPIWLIEQYNPDVDFGSMRPGTQIVVPRIEDVASAGG
ncbi:MAG: transglycosylase SLT domain-containing protein [Steroidobacteraceae bacterium]